jgi:hypothetical protein
MGELKKARIRCARFGYDAHPLKDTNLVEATGFE